MSKQELENLVKSEKLKVEPASRAEFDGMMCSARTRLADAQNESIDSDSQFDLAYAWSSPIEGSDKRRFFAVLHQPPVTSPAEAVRAAIVAGERAKNV